MKIDRNKVKLFLMNFDEAHRTAGLLRSSYSRLRPLMPLTGEKMSRFDDEELDRLDAFRVRFGDLQDLIGAKLFRSILSLEEEVIGSQLDSINKMEKRGIIPSFEAWKEIRDIRNLFIHDYPDDDEQRAVSLNIAYESVSQLIDVFNAIREYVERKLHISLDKFTEISISDGDGR